MQSATIRINRESRAMLAEMAQAENEPAVRIVQKALENYRRKVFLRRCGDAYQALRSDAKKWKEEGAERGRWDSTLGDGQEKDE